ncbi:hypothetical protein VCV18_011386 [Metarhizium anisopliae]
MVRRYRVSDNSAQARWVRGRGILTPQSPDEAEIRPFLEWPRTPQWELQRYAESLLDHLEWTSDRISPFISATKDYGWAKGEALRRVEDEEENVVIYHIETEGPEGNVQFRPLGSILQRLGIPEDELNHGAQALLDHECLFLYEIPDDAIVFTEHVRG